MLTRPGVAPALADVDQVHVKVTDPRESRPAWLLDKLSGVDSDINAHDRQLATVQAFLSEYRAAGVIAEERACPLDEACPSAATCWDGFGPDARPDPVDGAISVPWVGPGYERGGLACVAINFNKYGGLGAQWWTINGARRHLRAGRKPAFAYHAGTYLALLLQSAGQMVLDGTEPEPSDVADAWDQVAFVEAVKCSPMSGVGEPSDAMWDNCPPRYLRGDLELLAPSVVLTVGRLVADAVGGALSVEWSRSEQGAVRRGYAEMRGRPVEIVACNHPSYGHWRASTPALATSLREQPISLLYGKDD